ncbi:TldD/PmbA family protein [Methanimicrococcus blatticola]|uniref:PmbA protein n=1 Tax=Methanimicrococcus blatticola TaxID=91560 RepID=A0A484F445_9EURY|nr:TldD/PmbA family protein [Methanimicrococcus blatticola]MBZ3935607.1 TldD/PmbA family protein [Methanimicrococcus blatticola]MCC2509248.1 TldD/PmbA family protein [Methanimicrococcus blatticola]TDQ69386.1 PmbA protein [Methanimicrococcus blatticola]
MTKINADKIFPENKISIEEIKSGIEKALALSEKLGASDAEIVFSIGESTSIQFKKDIIETAKQSTSAGYGVRAVVNGAVGFAGTNLMSDLENTLRTAVASAKVMEADPLFKNFPEKAVYKEVGGLFDDKIVDMSLDECIECATDMISGVKSIENMIPTSGGFSRSVSYFMIMNTDGLSAQRKGTAVSGFTDVTTASGEVSTAYDYNVSRKKDVDFTVIGKNAADLAKKSLKGISCGAEKMPVIFHPFSFADILENTLVPSVDADNIQKERSGLVGRLGDEIAHSDLSIIDNGTLEGGISSGAFDDEGTPTQKTTVIGNGILKSYLYDSYTAGKDNVKSTGNGYRYSYSSAPGVDFSNFIIDFPQSDVIAETKKGIYVNTVIGAHTANEISGDFSIEGRNAFLIENGEISKPIKSVMISGNIFEMLKNIDGAGKDVRSVGGIITPSIRISEMSVIGE